VQRLLKEGPPSLIYLTSRNEDLGRAALEEVKKVESKSQVEWAQLDISDNASIQKLAKELKEKHGKIQVRASKAV
jgi:NAD(P)-dependent dehydrogenase (short-subunit alcohol dehydrogenase family)